MGRRGDVLELAVLGLLHESAMHGYELRKRLNTLLGTFRALSYGTLYPCLKTLLADGWIRETDVDATASRSLPGERRSFTNSPRKVRNASSRWSATRGPRRGRTSGSTSTSPSSPGPTPPPGCRSSKAGAAGCRNAAKAFGSRWRAAESGSINTPSSFSDMVSRRSTARCVGSLS